MSYKKLKEILENLEEDYLSLDDKLVEVGVLSYLHQHGKLNSSKEKKLYQYIEESTEDISKIIGGWFYAHGLIDKLREIGLTPEEVQDYGNLAFDSDIIGEFRSKVQENIFSETDSDDYEITELAKDMSHHLGGEQFFGYPAVEPEDLSNFINKNLVVDDGYEKESEDEPDMYYFDATNNEIRTFLMDCKESQVEHSGDFMAKVDDMISAIDSIKTDLVSYDIDSLVLDFDHLKDLNHMNGNLLVDYGGIDFDEINDRVENDPRIK